MKQLTLLFSLLFFAQLSFAQIDNPKKATKFIKRANLYISSSDLKTGKKELDSADNYVNSASIPLYWVTKGNFYFEIATKGNTDYVEPKEAYKLSFDAFYQGQQLDTNRKLKNQIDPKLFSFYNHFVNSAIIAFDSLKDYKQAQEYFEYVIRVKSMPFYKGEIDTAMHYFAGLSAYNAENYDAAAKHLLNAISYGYGDEGPYMVLKNNYLANNDTTAATEILKKAFEKYPQKLIVVVELINHYLSIGKSADALLYLQVAKEKEPNNATYCFAEGTLYEELKNPEKALEAYKSAIEKDKNYFEPYYNAGVLYYNKAIEIINNAAAIPVRENARYEAEINKSKAILNDALPFLEKALELKPDNKNTLISLKEIYHRLGMHDKRKAVDAKLKEIE
jgi:tetratricopeptide (TPR) repeat protein